jgi:hypothetical protein
LRHGKPGNTTLEEFAGSEPKLLKGDGLLDAVENRRRRVRELRADLHRIASAPYPSSHAKQHMREAIETFAQRGTPDVSMLIEHDGDIAWPMLRVQSEVIGAVQRPARAGRRADRTYQQARVARRHGGVTFISPASWRRDQPNSYMFSGTKPLTAFSHRA